MAAHNRPRINKGSIVWVCDCFCASCCVLFVVVVEERCANSIWHIVETTVFSILFPLDKVSMCFDLNCVEFLFYSKTFVVYFFSVCFGVDFHVWVVIG